MRLSRRQLRRMILKEIKTLSEQAESRSLFDTVSQQIVDLWSDKNKLTKFFKKYRSTAFGLGADEEEAQQAFIDWVGEKSDDSESASWSMASKPAKGLTKSEADKLMKVANEIARAMIPQGGMYRGSRNAGKLREITWQNPSETDLGLTDGHMYKVTKEQISFVRDMF